ncbi:MAG: 2-phosphosulfolactate phosphatase [Lachnospiraceae bacterium]|jgi:2-phosphosulfolactate phosphatase|nr:2-phosphosulfolactate phosphatase [Lachnospiraceae bacterium]
MQLLNNDLIKINTYHLIEGAKKATGLTVIIDVFRAFSLECYLYNMGVSLIRPVGTIEEAFAFKKANPNYVLIGERKGRKCEGFDFGNSPSETAKHDLRGKTVIHTTSAGTQGIINAKEADEIITGSLVNAKAVARYIMENQPKEVSLVCMGNGGIAPAKEDELCAEYIRSILEGAELPDMDERVKRLRYEGGAHFFDRQNQDVFPEPDFWMCIEYNKFDFVLKIEKDEKGFLSRPVR